MKTTTLRKDYDEVVSIPKPAHRLPHKPNLFWRTLIRLLTVFGMAGTQFQYETERMEQIPKNQPCLILMNHSCFLDMQIAYRTLYPRPFCIICTSDAFVGMGGLMNWLLRTIGCIPTQKNNQKLTQLLKIILLQPKIRPIQTQILTYKTIPRIEPYIP